MLIVTVLTAYCTFVDIINLLNIFNLRFFSPIRMKTSGPVRKHTKMRQFSYKAIRAIMKQFRASHQKEEKSIPVMILRKKVVLDILYKPFKQYIKD